MLIQRDCLEEYRRGNLKPIPWQASYQQELPRNFQRSQPEISPTAEQSPCAWPGTGRALQGQCPFISITSRATRELCLSAPHLPIAMARCGVDCAGAAAASCGKGSSCIELLQPGTATPAFSGVWICYNSELSNCSCRQYQRLSSSSRADPFFLAFGCVNMMTPAQPHAQRVAVHVYSVCALSQGNSG